MTDPEKRLNQFLVLVLVLAFFGATFYQHPELFWGLVGLVRTWRVALIAVGLALVVRSALAAGHVSHQAEDEAREMEIQAQFEQDLAHARENRL